MYVAPRPPTLCSSCWICKAVSVYAAGFPRCLTCIAVAACSIKKKITLLPVIAIPSHTKCSDPAKCPVKQLYPWMPCNCAKAKVRGLHKEHWEALLTHKESPWRPYLLRMAGVAVIADRLKCHYSEASLAAFYEFKIVPCYLYPSKSRTCGPLPAYVASCFVRDSIHHHLTDVCPNVCPCTRSEHPFISSGQRLVCPVQGRL